MNIYTPSMKPAETIQVPARIEYPVQSKNVPAGFLKLGDQIEVNFTITDIDGNVKLPKTVDVFRLPIFPEGKELSMIANVRFFEEDKSVELPE